MGDGMMRMMDDDDCVDDTKIVLYMREMEMKYMFYDHRQLEVNTVRPVEC